MDQLFPFLDHTRSSLFQTNVVRLAADVIMPEVRLAHVFGAMLDMPSAVFVSMFLPCTICPLRIAIVRLADVCITAVHLARA